MRDALCCHACTNGPDWELPLTDTAIYLCCPGADAPPPICMQARLSREAGPAHGRARVVQLVPFCGEDDADAWCAKLLEGAAAHDGGSQCTSSPLPSDKEAKAGSASSALAMAFALYQAPPAALQAVTALDFSGCDLQLGMQPLAMSLMHSPALQQRVRTLKLCKCGLTDEGLQQLAQALGACTALAELDVSGNPFCDAGVCSGLLPLLRHRVHGAKLRVTADAGCVQEVDTIDGVVALLVRTCRNLSPAFGSQACSIPYTYLAQTGCVLSHVLKHGAKLSMLYFTAGAAACSCHLHSPATPAEQQQGCQRHVQQAP